MVSYYLSKHEKFNWYQNGDVCYRCGFGLGSFDSLFHDGQLEGKIDITVLGNKLREINGNFCLIIKKENNVYLCSDRTQSFPVLYYLEDDDIIISDSVSYIQSKQRLKLREQSLKEMVSMGVAIGDKTLYENLFVVEAAQIVKIDLTSGKIDKYTYFQHKHGEYYGENYSELSEKLDQVLYNMFKHIKESIKDRLIVVPLSGGYDSRLVVTSLKKLNIKNVLCVSYGTYINKEVKVARKLANSLGYRWIYVKQTKQEIENLANDTDFWKCMKEISGASAIPYLQNFAIYKLKKEGRIPSDAVVMTGNSGDVLEGDQMPECFEEKRYYSRNELLNAILNKHFRLAGPKGASDQNINESIIDLYLDKQRYSYEEVNDIYELFNWRERQSQFLFNDGLFYSDFCGLEWYFPLWDINFVNFWLHVPMELRYKRKFYYYYVNKEQLKTANDPTLYQNLLQLAKEKLYKLLIRFYIAKRIIEYCFNGDRIWHLLNFKDYKKMLKWTGGVGTNSNTAVIWALLKNSFGINVETIKLGCEKREYFELK